MKIEIAWAAGLVDGEGCIYIARKKAGGANGAKTDSFVLGIKVTMTHRLTIERLQRIFMEGNIHVVTAPANPKWKQAYSFVAQSRRAESVIKKLLPYLTAKKAEAELALKFMQLPIMPKGGSGGSSCVTHGWFLAREKAWIEMRRLKGRL